jgi:hypothetical protein
VAPGVSHLSGFESSQCLPTIDILLGDLACPGGSRVRWREGQLDFFLGTPRFQSAKRFFNRLRALPVTNLLLVGVLVIRAGERVFPFLVVCFLPFVWIRGTRYSGPTLITAHPTAVSPLPSSLSLGSLNLDLEKAAARQSATGGRN